MSAALLHAAGRLVRERRGATVLEFAFVVPVFLLLAVGTIELGMIAYGTAMLEGGLREAARFGMTGLLPQSGTREERIVEIVNRNGGGVVKITEANITTLVYPNFTSIGEAEPYVDANGNGAYDGGEPFTDINCNGGWDPDMGRAGLGSGGEVVLYEVRYDMPLYTGMLDWLIGNDGKFPLASTIALRNEPFTKDDPAC